MSKLFKFSQLHVLYLTLAIRLGANATFLAVIYFTYSSADLADYFLGVAAIQLLFLIFGVFATPYFITRYVTSKTMAKRFAPRQFVLNLASWCGVLVLAIAFAPEYLWLVFFFVPMVFSRVCDDLTKSSDGFKIFLTTNLISAIVASALKVLSAVIAVDLVWLFAFVYLEEVIRGALYLAMPQFWYVLRGTRLNRKRVTYYRKVVMRTFGHGSSSFLTGVNYRVLFLTLGAHAPDASVAIAGYFSRIFDIGNGLVVQYAVYRFNKDRPTSVNLEEVMAPIYRFSRLALGLSVVLLMAGAVLYAVLPSSYKYLAVFLAAPTCVAVSLLNINRVIIFNILKQPKKLLFSSVSAFLVTAAIWGAAPYTGLELLPYLGAFLVLVILQSTLFDALFLGRMRHARLLREVLAEAPGRRKEPS